MPANSRWDLIRSLKGLSGPNQAAEVLDCVGGEWQYVGP